MKRNTTLLMALLAGSLLLLQCTKEAPQQVLKTRLVITLRYSNGDTLKGVPVRLYRENAADTTAIVQLTDSNGIALYSDLQIATYRWLVRQDCKTNLASQTTLGKPLIEGVALYGYSVVTETSTLKVSKTDTARYKLSDSTLKFDILGDSAFTTYPKVGRHRLTQQRVYAPTVKKDTIIVFNCNDIITLNIPF